MNDVLSLVQKLETELVAYTAKPTKACSARIRKLTQQLNNDGPSIRKALVAADKKGYK